MLKRQLYDVALLLWQVILVGMALTAIVAFGGWLYGMFSPSLLLPIAKVLAWLWVAVTVTAILLDDK